MDTIIEVYQLGLGKWTKRRRKCKVCGAPISKKNKSGLCRQCAHMKRKGEAMGGLSDVKT